MNVFMDSTLNDRILCCTGATEITGSSPIQSLWSGYGQIMRVGLNGAEVPSVVVKHVRPPQRANQPRGWNTQQSHQRKLHSYQVESKWYRDWAERLDETCRVARCFFVDSDNDEHLFVLEDLDASGFHQRFASQNLSQIRSGLRWLANFHATFLSERRSRLFPSGLWPCGTYWHLATRPDEFAELRDGEPLKRHAAEIDKRLSQCQYGTIVHGDAKVANFCFSDANGSVAAVDFQYVGGGCGMKDVAYFLGSCLGEAECEKHAGALVDFYFASLGGAIDATETSIDPADVEAEWRMLYPLAWADFNRFLLGWYPQHDKLHRYSRRLTDQAIAMIEHPTGG
tara:strand:+ start:119573 stop:120592 length:1020 start_codon:yes stop_codon:yes gene_type:complete